MSTHIYHFQYIKENQLISKGWWWKNMEEVWYGMIPIDVF